MIPYGRQYISEEDIDAVVQVLRSDFLTQGPAIPKFEDLIRNYCGASHAVSVNNATSALYLACRAVGLGAGDWLWTSPITFAASSNSALLCGAHVDFVDIDPDTFNMDPVCLEKKLQHAEKQNQLPKVVMPVHMCGQSCDMAAIHQLAGKYGFRVIEDASHAVGGRYKNKAVGSCQYSDITVFSFHPVKIITTGEGGIALTNDAGLAEAMREMRSHGITRDTAKMRNAPHGPWYYEQLELSLNFRITDLQAALGASQMKRLDNFVAKRHELARCYDQALGEFPVKRPGRNPDAYSSFHLYIVRLKRRDREFRRKVFEVMREAKIGVNVHYIPVYLHPYYYNLGFRPGCCPQAESYYSCALTLPLHPRLTVQEQGEVIDTLFRGLMVAEGKTPV